MKLYGITPKGDVITRTTRVHYQWALIKAGDISHVRCSADLGNLIRSAASGDWLIGLTRVPLTERTAKYVTITAGSRSVIRCYPKCYACDNPALGRAERWDGKKRTYQPACITRHAQQEIR